MNNNKFSHKNFINVDDIDFDNTHSESEDTDDIKDIKDTEKDTEKDTDDIKDNTINKKDTFIWEAIHPKWEKKVLSKNFVIKNCLADGNCQFRSIETALTNAGIKTNHERLRKSICKYINNLDNNDFFNIIQNYRLEKQTGEFEGDWDPFSIKNKRDFTKELRKPGFNFQGDNITLSLISKCLEIDIIILDSDLNVTDLSNPDHLFPKIIIIFYDKQNKHYRTIGLKCKKKINTIFKRIDLPDELTRLIDKNTFFLHHIQNVCLTEMKCKKLELNKIIKNIEEKFDTKISSNDKKSIMKIIRTILDNENYFNKIKSN
jgi:hypothetical protein